MAKLYFSNMKLRNGDTVLPIDGNAVEIPLTPGLIRIVPTIDLKANADAIAFCLHDDGDANLVIKMDQTSINVVADPLMADEHDLTINPYIDKNYLYIALEKKSGTWAPGIYNLVAIHAYYNSEQQPDEPSILSVKVVYIN